MGAPGFSVMSAVGVKQAWEGGFLIYFKSYGNNHSLIALLIIDCG